MCARDGMAFLIKDVATNDMCWKVDLPSDFIVAAKLVMRNETVLAALGTYECYKLTALP